jgi:hypothetical protein
MAILADRSADVNRLFMDHFDRIQSIINQRCWSEERRQNALCWAWDYFRRYLPAAECPQQAAVAAAVFACRRRRTFGKEPRSGYVDALDRCESQHVVDVAGPDERPTDRGWCIEDMPPRLQLVGLCLGHGLNRQQTADKIGYSVEWVRRVCGEIEEWILARQPAKYARRVDAA